MRRRRERGIALVSVIWASVLISTIAGSLVHSTRTDLRIARNTIANAQARALADGGVYLAIGLLLESQRDRDRRWDGEAFTRTFADGSTTISVVDEAGKIDVNEASPDLLRELFLAHELPFDRSQALADAVVDWRDPDSSRRPAGAEVADYRSAGLSVEPRNAPFLMIDEIQDVFGVTSEVFRRVSPALTVNSGQRGVDPQVAPAAALRALLPSEGDVEQFLADRRELGERVQRRVLTSRRVPRRFLAVSTRRSYSIRSTARMDSGAVFRRDVVVTLTRDRDRPFWIESWRRTVDDAN